MSKRNRNLYVLMTTALTLPVWVSGCPTTSLGIDLSVRGGLVMEITEDLDSGNSTVTARIRNTLGGPSMLLTDDQSLAVNGAYLLTQEDIDNLEGGQHRVTVRRYRTETASPAFADLLDSAEVSVGVQRGTEFNF